jgi:hypothetical protein
VLGASPTGSVAVAEGSSQTFSVRASDADGDALAYSWYIDGSAVAGANTENFVYRPARSDIGRRDLRVSVSDGLAQTSYSWSVTVERQNRPPSIGSRQPSADTVDMAEEELVRFSVAAADPDGDRLAYEWLLDGQKVSSGQDFLYAPDYASAGTHSVGVTVTDGRSNATSSWTVRVKDVNRAPKVTLASPSDGEAFASGAEIFFECRATDADADRLEYRWSSDRAGVIGTSASFSKTLPAGTHRLTLVVSDGKTDTSVDITITVKAKAQPGAKTPGFEAALLAAALAAAMLAVTARRHRK